MAARRVQGGAPIVEERVPVAAGGSRHVWIVEDEPAAAALAADMCEAGGASTSVFSAPFAFLAALRQEPSPAAIILDWRLGQELSAALFLAIRHRHPRVPIVYWTGSTADSLPAMIRADRYTVIVDKAAGMLGFEEALAWALDDEADSGSIA